MGWPVRPAYPRPKYSVAGMNAALQKRWINPACRLGFSIHSRDISPDIRVGIERLDYVRTLRRTLVHRPWRSQFRRGSRPRSGDRAVTEAGKFTDPDGGG